MDHCSRASKHASPTALSVVRFMLFEQAVAHQKRDAALANFDRRDHGHTRERRLRSLLARIVDGALIAI
jgi:hypothetical protein